FTLTHANNNLIPFPPQVSLECVYTLAQLPGDLQAAPTQTAPHFLHTHTHTHTDTHRHTDTLTHTHPNTHAVWTSLWTSTMGLVWGIVAVYLVQTASPPWFQPMGSI